MNNLKNKDIEWYKSEGRLEFFQKTLDNYWDNSRQVESEAIVDLDKHIWLLNSGAATLLIGYLQTQSNVSCWQLYSAISFILGIVFLFMLKYLSAFLTSRDRFRFQDANSKFLDGMETDYVFKEVRDITYKCLHKSYVFLQFISGVMFILGLVFLLVAAWPKP